MIVVYYLHSDFRSVVGWIVNEYLKAIDMYGGKYPESMSWNICELELRDRLMTIDNQNEIYKNTLRTDFRKKQCSVCPYSKKCLKFDVQVDECIEIADMLEFQRACEYD